MIAATSSGEAVLALLILMVVAGMFVCMFVDLDALVCELQGDGSEVGGGGEWPTDVLTTRAETAAADTFPREWTLARTGPYDQDAA